MSHLEIIERLCVMLQHAEDIIAEQAKILEAHEITTYDGRLERERTKLLEDIEHYTGKG